jgi:hypothetical protein
MPEPTSAKHYESKFEFPLWRLIQRRADEKDISYSDAADEVLPEYTKGIRYGDQEFEDAARHKRGEELKKLFGQGRDTADVF